MADSNHSSSPDDALGRLMERGFEQLTKADKLDAKNGAGKSVKIAGILEVPESIAMVAEGLLNQAADEVTQWLKTQSHPKFMKAAEGLGLYGNAQYRAAAATTIALNTLVRGSIYLPEIKTAFKEMHLAKSKLAKKLAPALDELKGAHTVDALLSVKEQDNEMLYYAHKRVAMERSTEIKNSFTKLIVNVTPNLMLDFPGNKRLWKNQSDAELSANEVKIKKWGSKILNIGVGPAVAGLFKRSRDRKLQEKLPSPYSAAEMVAELQEQVENNPKATSYQLPGKGAKQLALGAYIEQILLMHQRNMAEINPDHVEIRPALKEDLEAVVKPLTEAIRKGEMDVTALTSLIGTGKIIKSQGRAIVNVAEVEELIAKETDKIAVHAHGDPKRALEHANYTPTEGKKVASMLEGKAQDAFTVTASDDVLRALDVADDEIKKRRGAVKGRETEELAALVIGAHEVAPEKLEQMASREKRVVDEAYVAIEKKGVEGLKPLMATHGHGGSGIEKAMNNLAVSMVSGDKEYFGKVVDQGHQKLAEMSEKTAEIDTKAPNTLAKYAKNGYSHGAQEMADRDSDVPHGGHAHREEQRASKAHTDHHFRD